MTQAYCFFQASWIVNDIQAAMRQWQKTAGVGPFFLNESVVLTKPLWRGEPVNFEYSLAIAQAGAMQIELIQQHDDHPSPYRDSHPRGTEGFHHLASFVSNVEVELARYRAAGLAVALDCHFGDVPLAYVDTRPTLGCMLEILEHRPSIDALFDHIAVSAVDWDGSDPIRPIPDLSAAVQP